MSFASKLKKQIKKNLAPVLKKIAPAVLPGIGGILVASLSTKPKQAKLPAPLPQAIAPALATPPAQMPQATRLSPKELASQYETEARNTMPTYEFYQLRNTGFFTWLEDYFTKNPV